MKMNFSVLTINSGRRRRGSVLIITFIVMILLAIISVSLMGIVYMNMRSAEQGDAIIRTRVAAHSILYVLGSIASRDIGNNRDPLGIKDGTPLTATFEDEGQNMRFTIEGSTTSFERAYTLTCTARYVVRHGSSPAKEEVKATVREYLEVKKRFTTDEEGGTRTSAQWIWLASDDVKYKK